jgi:hypothetical protein
MVTFSQAMAEAEAISGNRGDNYITLSALIISAVVPGADFFNDPDGDAESASEGRPSYAGSFAALGHPTFRSSGIAGHCCPGSCPGSSSS